MSDPQWIGDLTANASNLSLRSSSRGTYDLAPATNTTVVSTSCIFATNSRAQQECNRSSER